jgi:hypothetical protein
MIEKHKKNPKNIKKSPGLHDENQALEVAFSTQEIPDHHPLLYTVTK